MLQFGNAQPVPMVFAKVSALAQQRIFWDGGYIPPMADEEMAS
jgi:hypothetical protein